MRMWDHSVLPKFLTFSGRCRNRVLLSCICSLSTASWSQSPLQFESAFFTIPHGVDRLAPVDLNGDGFKDIVASDGLAIYIYLYQRNSQSVNPGSAPFNFNNPDATLQFDNQSVGWHLLDNQIVAVLDGKQVIAWQFSASESKTLVRSVLIDQLDGYLPPGVYPLQFVQDINGDVLADFVIPATNSLSVFLQKAEGKFVQGLQVYSQSTLESELRVRDNLNVFVGQQVHIPRLTARDVNNDQLNDLIVVSDDWLQVYLSDEQGGYPVEPSYALDRNAIKERVGEVDYDKIDYGNLSGLLAHTYEFRLEDLDGDLIDDLLVREGGRVIVYGGTKAAMNFDKPRQVLKSAGNVMGINLRDEDGDGFNDLWLTRIETVSVGNIFLWLAISGSVDMETFIYKNTGREFSRRPHRKITATLAFPSLFRSADLVMNAAEQSAQADAGRALFAHIAGNASSLDVIQLRRDGIAVFIDILSNLEDRLFMGASDYSIKKNEYRVDLEKTLRNPGLGKDDQRRLVDDKNPDFVIPYVRLPVAGVGDDIERQSLMGDTKMSSSDLAVADLNGDGIDDVFVVTERAADKLVGSLLLSRP